jgi:hypothetical protein
VNRLFEREGSTPEYQELKFTLHRKLLDRINLEALSSMAGERVRVEVRWTALAATVCPPWSLGRVITLQPCAQGIGGWLSATGRGLTNPRSVGRTWWSAGAMLRLGAHIGADFTVELEAGASVPIVGRRFTSSSPDRTVGETPTISPMVALGLSRSL